MTFERPVYELVKIHSSLEVGTLQVPDRREESGRWLAQSPAAALKTKFDLQKEQVLTLHFKLTPFFMLIRGFFMVVLLHALHSHITE